ncbi:hypothetical protein HW561_00650 [Rhodobacteraceae bacterium B1Z28]|uniref:Uncharacterized protein n=1 Tax=Ruegeria haliotis TaxID=2747601 RepID=A0ABX2PJK5_9RHOB|nr:hypothetical protein [Ruegeria haliotis]NVO54297.1 hypothetical protein [Ruegeria haliotis]
MSVKHIAGFAAICGLVVAGLDYAQQSKAVEGGLSPQAYLVSVSSRIGVVDEAVFASPRSYLPVAPEGWSRRALSEGNRAPVWPETGNQDAKKAAANGWQYVNGDETIWVEAFRNELSKSKGVMSGMAEISASKIAYQPDYQGFAVLGGVGFAEMNVPSGQDRLAHRVFDGWVGFDDEIQIRVRADASDDSVRTLLGAIDYDGLNGLLKDPISTIGKGVQVQPELEAEIATEMLELRRVMVKLRADAAVENKLKSDDAVQVFNSFMEGIAPAAVLDATGGEAPDSDALIQTAYRNALVLILAEEGVEQKPQMGGGKLICTKVGTSKRCRSGG